MAESGNRSIAVVLAALAALVFLSPWRVMGQPPDESGQVSQEAAFANNLTSAINFIAEYHVTPATHSQMARWSVEGLYTAMKLPIPPEIGKRLEKLEKRDLRRLFQDVRASLGKRKELEKDQDVKICIQAIIKGMSVERAYELFLGKKGTRVILQVIPAGSLEKGKN